MVVQYYLMWNYGRKRQLPVSTTGLPDIMIVVIIGFSKKKSDVCEEYFCETCRYQSLVPLSLSLPPLLLIFDLQKIVSLTQLSDESSDSSLLPQ